MVNVTESHLDSDSETTLLNKALAIEAIAEKVLAEIFGGREDYTIKFFSEKYGQFATSHSIEIFDLLDNLDLKPDQVFIDLGTGNGKWVLVAALLGLHAYGVEHNPDLIKAAEITKAEAIEQKVMTPEQAQNATFILGDLKTTDIQAADIVLYAQGSGAGNQIIEDKIRSQAKAGAMVIINSYIRGFEGLPQVDTTGRFNQKARVFTIPSNSPPEIQSHPHL